MPQNFPNEKSTLVQVMAWCLQATSHYLSQCWPRPKSPEGVTRPQWVKSCIIFWLKATYLEVKCKSMRASMSTFRISAHQLDIETGQYCDPPPPVPRENWYCSLYEPGEAKIRGWISHAHGMWAKWGNFVLAQKCSKKMLTSSSRPRLERCTRMLVPSNSLWCRSAMAASASSSFVMCWNKQGKSEGFSSCDRPSNFSACVKFDGWPQTRQIWGIW